MTQSPPAPRKLTARVTEKQVLAGGIVRLWLQPLTEGDADFSFLPGQYLRLYLADFEPRDYSIASQPGDPALEFHIKDHGEGGASSFVAQRLSPGDHLPIEGPFGTCILRSDHEGPLLGVAGGTGLAPVYNILVQALRDGFRQPVRLYYGASNEAEIFLHDDFRKLTELFDNFSFSLVSMDQNDALPQGKVTDLLSPDEPLAGARAYVAGPPPMVEASVARLKELGLPEERIHADAFTLGPALPQATDEA